MYNLAGEEVPVQLAGMTIFHEGRYLGGAIKALDLRATKELERENRELKRANEILRKASARFAQAELDRRPK